MIKRATNCAYCDAPIVSKSAKRRYCGDKCRIYHGREKEYEKPAEIRKKERELKKKLQKTATKKNRVKSDFVKNILGGAFTAPTNSGEE